MGREVMQNSLEEQLNTAQRTGRTQRAEELMGAIARLNKFRTYATARTFRIGDIAITPYFVSHSAADSHMLLVECDSKRALHTGDFRDHGFTGKGLTPTLARIGQVDALIIEGTTLSRDGSASKSEYQIQQDMLAQMEHYKNIFVVCSSTNFDRLAGLYQDTLKIGRPFVCDKYQKRQLDTLRKYSGKHSWYYNVRNALPMSLNAKSLHKNMFERGFTMVVRNNANFRKWIGFIKEHIDLAETLCIYSQYLGYLEEQPSLREFVDSFGCKVEYIHTSGHASPEAIEEVCRTLNPRSAIIPIHKDATSDLHTLNLPDELKAKIIAADTAQLGFPI